MVLHHLDDHRPVLLGVVPVHQTAGVHKSFDRGFGLHSWLCQRLQPGSNTGSQPGGRRGSGGAFPASPLRRFRPPRTAPDRHRRFRWNCYGFYVENLHKGHRRPHILRPGHRRVLNCPGHHPKPSGGCDRRRRGWVYRCGGYAWNTGRRRFNGAPNDGPACLRLRSIIVGGVGFAATDPHGRDREPSSSGSPSFRGISGAREFLRFRGRGS